jgi:hypothetical protein
MVVLCTSAQADILLQHVGMNTPASEGFNIHQSTSGANTEAMDYTVDPQVPAEVIWEGWNRFGANLTTAQNSTMAADGWYATANINATDELGTWPYDAASNGIYLEVTMTPTGSSTPQAYGLTIGTDSTGNPVLGQANVMAGGMIGSAYPISPLGSGYHLYEMRYDPNAGLGMDAKVYVDGAYVATMTPQAASGVPERMMWGASNAAAPGNWTYWNSATLSSGTVPEPSTLILLLSAVTGLMAYTWRNRQ